MAAIGLPESNERIFMISDLAVAAARRFPHPISFWLLRKATGTQITPRQLQTISQAIRDQSACKLLVFGLGYDSVYWHRLNRDGSTLFLEDDDAWIDVVRARSPELAVARVSYWTQQKDWRSLAECKDRLALELPEAVRQQRWDVILVDAPAGWGDHTPGRMQSIYTAGLLCGPGGTVFVHDCEREAEAHWCDLVFTPDRLLRVVAGERKHGWLRQYRPLANDSEASTTQASVSPDD